MTFLNLCNRRKIVWFVVSLINGICEITNMFDVIIVGAGPAGIACALRTKELNLKPLLIDSGFIANT
ncbi:MAG: FAD-dependent oxidoreductase, partial [Candidatus Aenigmarchaeota archaeon]|nr:FAD-dependent oxidoreductase [Candidatus Aenigmarchaeota archaeon]